MHTNASFDIDARLKIITSDRNNPSKPLTTPYNEAINQRLFEDVNCTI